MWGSLLLSASNCHVKPLQRNSANGLTRYYPTADAESTCTHSTVQVAIPVVAVDLCILDNAHTVGWCATTPPTSRLTAARLRHIPRIHNLSASRRQDSTESLHSSAKLKEPATSKCSQSSYTSGSCKQEGLALEIWPCAGASG